MKWDSMLSNQNSQVFMTLATLVEKNIFGVLGNNPNILVKTNRFAADPSEGGIQTQVSVWWKLNLNMSHATIQEHFIQKTKRNNGKLYNQLIVENRSIKVEEVVKNCRMLGCRNIDCEFSFEDLRFYCLCAEETLKIVDCVNKNQTSVKNKTDIFPSILNRKVTNVTKLSQSLTQTETNVEKVVLKNHSLIETVDILDEPVVDENVHVNPLFNETSAIEDYFVLEEVEVPDDNEQLMLMQVEGSGEYEEVEELSLEQLNDVNDDMETNEFEEELFIIDSDNSFDSTFVQEAADEPEQITTIPTFVLNIEQNLTSIDCIAHLEHHQLCDNIFDCHSQDDETDCYFGNCLESEFPCLSGRCIPGDWKCDGSADCDTGRDRNGNFALGFLWC